MVRADSGVFHAPALVVATGGLSIPKMGASGFGYDVARKFGLKIRATRPALVPFVLGANDRSQYCDLAGVSAEVAVSIDDHAFRDKMLFTHRGLSGPAILQISSYWNAGEPIRIDLAPGRDLAAAIGEGPTRNKSGMRPPCGSRCRNSFRIVLPSAGWTCMLLPRGTMQALAALDRQTHEWLLVPEETEGYEKAEVTAGGVDTDELSSKTMESRKVPGLFFIGEVVDVTGHLGGHNFQWAWASGACAGRAL